MYSEGYIKRAERAGFETTPSFYDLWKLIKAHYKNKTDCEVLSKIRIAMSQANCTSYLNKMDIHTLFLIGYMYEVKKKSFDSRTGQWEKI